MKMHVVDYGTYYFAFASQNDAIQLTKLLAKAQIVERIWEAKDKQFKEGTRHKDDPTLMFNVQVHPSKPPEPEQKTQKALALPTPKRGTILCICEKSYVAPKETCPHCGRPFSESHNRTHSDKQTTKNTTPNLRLL